MKNHNALFLLLALAVSPLCTASVSKSESDWSVDKEDFFINQKYTGEYPMTRLAFSYLSRDCETWKEYNPDQYVEPSQYVKSLNALSMEKKTRFFTDKNNTIESQHFYYEYRCVYFNSISGEFKWVEYSDYELFNSLAKRDLKIFLKERGVKVGAYN